MKLIEEKHIFLNQTFKQQTEVLRFLSTQAVALKLAVDQEEVYAKLIEREKEGTTGMLAGFAIPHAKAQTITEPAVLIVTLKEGVGWQSLDASPVDFVIGLLIPAAEAGTTHLKLLSAVARLLLRQEVTAPLKEARSAQKIAAILNNQLSEGKQ